MFKLLSAHKSRWGVSRKGYENMGDVIYPNEVFGHPLSSVWHARRWGLGKIFALHDNASPPSSPVNLSLSGIHVVPGIHQIFSFSGNMFVAIKVAT